MLSFNYAKVIWLLFGVLAVGVVLVDWVSLELSDWLFVSLDIIVNWGDWLELPDESLNDEVVVVTSIL